MKTRIVALLLAAGASRRFGATDKLLAPLEGAPLVAHSARALRALPFSRFLAVTSSAEVSAVLRDEAFDVLEIAPGDGQAETIRAGIARLRANADQCLLALGDMPYLQPGDYRRIMIAGEHGPACAIGGAGQTMPPAIFPSSWFGRLETLSGDRGAGRFLRDLPEQSRIAIAPERLRDIDQPDDLPPPGF